MATRKNSVNATVTEIKLHLSEAKSNQRYRNGTKPQHLMNTSNKSLHKHCGPSKINKNISQQTVSIQNFQFPESYKSKRVMAVPKQNVLRRMSSNITQETQTNCSEMNKATNTTDSHFNNMLFEVPKKFRAKCVTSNSSKNNEIDDNRHYRTHLITETSQQSLDTSQKMEDVAHKQSTKQTELRGPEWRQPCKESFVAGAPRKFIGKCLHNYELISKMSKTRQKFFLTQDPRKVHCLVNPDVLRTKAYSNKKEFNALTKMVKHAQNVCVPSASESSESFICEVIDLENPLNLDFQGLDYQNTYLKDEQDLQNQRNYRRMCRHIERNRIKKETAAKVEKELHEKRVQIPQKFQIRDRSVIPSPPPIEEPIKLGKLLRAADKPYNQALAKMERERRIERYKNLYLRNQERKQENNKQAELDRKMQEDTFGMTVAEENFNTFKQKVEHTIEHSFQKERLLRKPKVQRRIFPHTIHETEIFKRELKRTNRIRRDEARVKKEFYKKRTGKEKEYREAELEISIDSQGSTVSKLTEQSSDDEDNIEVGRDGDIFKLRGFHFKLGNQIRGKFHERQKYAGTSKEKGCITREQWLRELAPKKEKIKIDVGIGIQKQKNPDDPLLNLFPPRFGGGSVVVNKSPIKEYVAKPLGHQYDQAKRKKLKFVKPHLQYNVKKFNLISYRFGDTTKRLTEFKEPTLFEQRKSKLITTEEYIQNKAAMRKLQKDTIKQKRLKLLGIPCKTIKKSSLQTKCENSESSSNSDWVPEPEPEYDAHGNYKAENDKFSARIMPVRWRTNMPAPKFREPTLRQHPRRKRDYELLRVPSELLDQAVKETHIPHLYKTLPDKIDWANLAMEKRPYTHVFNARHHHDHWNPTQIRHVDVHYQTRIVKPDITKVKTKANREAVENFRMAHPPCKDFIEMDLTLPKWDVNTMLAEHLTNSKKKTDDTVRIKYKDTCVQEDKVFHSRDPEELKDLNYPGRQEYLQFLQEIKAALRESKNSEYVAEKLYVDKQALLRELEEDLRSIETCLTSLSSSACTNFTNDSGSFLLMEGKEKIPLDYIRKSLVPFEELHRSRLRAIPIDVDHENANPYRVVPFSGQKNTQMEWIKPNDSFFTFNTRLKNGLRLRLEVPVEDVREKLLGIGKNKHKCMVATDIDENYVSELKSRPPVKMYNFKTSPLYIKDALRLKFESMLIQGQIVRNKIYDRLNEQHWEDMLRIKTLYERLFAKWEKREYEASMAVIYKVKPYYEETDRLKTEFRELEREQVKLNMDIVFTEGHWISCIMLQNFHYLLGDLDWRLQNDWIHRKIIPKENNEDDNLETTSRVELEGYDESINKRSVINIRQREKDDAWAIKAFFEDVYLQNKHPNLIVFPDAESFLQGIENLKAKTFVLLLEMHFTLAIHSELQYRLETFKEWCKDDLEEKQEYVQRKCAKLYFMEDRAAWLRERTLNFLKEPINESFNNEIFNKDRAVIMEVWRNVVPATLRATNEAELEAVDMVAMITDVVLELLGKFENIPMELSRRIEHKLRATRSYLRKQSKQAYIIEKRIEAEMKNVVKNLQPPYNKPPRTGKLPHVILKKHIKPEIIPETRLSDRTKFFFRAFYEDDDEMQLSDVRESIARVDNMQKHIVPFYFDHFLKLNGYTPNYNFKTQVEMRDGPELNQLKIRSVVPEVVAKLQAWELRKTTIMEDHIAQNPKMYLDVS